VIDPDTDSTVQYLGLEPVVTSLQVAPDLAQAGFPVSLAASFRDLEVPDTHVATIDWGDGTGCLGFPELCEGVITHDGGTASGGSVEASHVYDAAGVYPVTLTATDGGGRSWSETHEFVVVFDPYGGFVTAAGRIDGAPPKTGFNINAQYVHCAASGLFQLRGYGDRFRSTEITWVVVTPEGTGSVQGVGEWGGVPGYLFQIDLVDLPGGETIEIRLYEAGADPFADDPLFVAGGGVNSAVQMHQ